MIDHSCTLNLRFKAFAKLKNNASFNKSTLDKIRNLSIFCLINNKFLWIFRANWTTHSEIFLNQATEDISKMKNTLIKHEMSLRPWQRPLFCAIKIELLNYRLSPYTFEAQRFHCLPQKFHRKCFRRFKFICIWTFNWGFIWRALENRGSPLHPTRTFETSLFFKFKMT